MKISKPVLAHAVIALAVVGALAFARAQPEPPADPQKAMEAWMASMQPGKPHEFLKQFVGEWNTTTRIWMAGPGSPPMESAGTASFSLVFGGRFLKQESTGQMMGMPMEGLGFTGYDNNRKLYFSSWIDSLSTGFYINSGNLDQTGTILTQFGTMDEPMTGEIGKMVKYVTRVADADTVVFEIQEVLYGDPFTVVQIEYKRKK